MSGADGDTAGSSGREEPPTDDRPSSRDKSVDASWKEQARREKEKLDAARHTDESGPLPEASFLGLVVELALRVLFALGEMPNPLTGTQEVDLPAARYTIDLLGVLEEKTSGNLSSEESAALVELLARLRMTYVHHVRGAAGGPKEGGGEGDGSRIIL